MGKKIERAAKRTLARSIASFFGVKNITPEGFARARVSKLLVIRQHNQMGDMLAASAAFRGLRKRFPDARISLVAASLNAEVARRNPFIDEVLVYAKERNRKNPFAFVRFIAELRRRRFDAVLVLNTFSFSVTSMLLAVASGARIRLGSTSRPFGHDLTAKLYHLELPLPPREESEKMHESVHNLYPLSLIGVDERDLSSVLVPFSGEERDCERFIAAAFGERSRFIVVHPGAGKKRNVWPPERFAEVASCLHDRTGMKVVAVRGPVDAAAMDAFLASCAVCPVVLSSPTVGFLGALMKRSALTLCNDTGIMHVAGAVGARCVAVFGPTDPGRWKPVNDTVVAVKAMDGDVGSVRVDEVLAAAHALLGG